MLALLLPLSALGHVRLRYNGYPIRNAPSPLTDGLFSTAGMCGGNSKWNAMGYSDSIRDGDTITLKMSYNGGHTSPANLFKAKMHCLSSSAAQPHITESMMTSAAVIPASAGASCEAVASDSRIDPPYELRCKLPAQQVQADQQAGGRCGQCECALRKGGAAVQIHPFPPCAARRRGGSGGGRGAVAF